MNRVDGLDYGTAIEYIRANPNDVDQCWIGYAEGMAKTGHGGVPPMVYQNEPFFGGDRFDQFIWGLNQSGLTKRPTQRPHTPPKVCVGQMACSALFRMCSQAKYQTKHQHKCQPDDAVWQPAANK
ncbi:hypothetical protein GCM10008940_23360 [Microbulbifer agarilyticus]